MICSGQAGEVSSGLVRQGLARWGSQGLAGCGLSRTGKPRRGRRGGVRAVGLGGHGKAAEVRYVLVRPGMVWHGSHGEDRRVLVWRVVPPPPARVAPGARRKEGDLWESER